MVYRIQCRREKSYTGQAGRSINCRIKEHQHNIAQVFNEEQTGTAPVFTSKEDKKDVQRNVKILNVSEITRKEII